jgi:glycosyltransferase involved in cell wall biosynthesis
MSRLNILFFTQVLPYPLVGGAKIRAYYMLRHLAQQHDVTLVSFVREDDDTEAIVHLRDFCHAVHTVPMARSLPKDGRSLLNSLLSQRPMVIVRDRIPEMERKVETLVEEKAFDVIHADQTSMAQYALFARAVHGGVQRPCILLDQHNALYLMVGRQAKHERGQLKRTLWRREAKLLARYEAELCREFDEILTVSSEDRDALLTLLPDEEAAQRRDHFTVIPICVDPSSQPAVAHKDMGPRIVHLGTMFWPPNVEGVLWFVEEILPRVLKAVPETIFVIAGKNPPPEVQALSAPGSPLAEHVEVTGFVEDPEPLLASSRVFVVPLLAGGGMRVKIVDAWQRGLAVISTSIGAEGIKTRPGENILLADEPLLFADAVIRVLTERDLADKLRKNGRSWVEQQYDWRRVYKGVDAIYGRFQPVPA